MAKDAGVPPQKENPQTWLRSLVETFREAVSKLSPEERVFVSNLDNFSAPLQMELIWFRPPDIQYLIATHFKQHQDMEITVDGPFHPSEAVDHLDQILSREKWSVPTPPDDGVFGPKGESDNSFRSAVLESVFVSMAAGLSHAALRKPPEKAFVGAQFLLEPDAFVWDIWGDITQSDPSKLATEIAEGARTQSRAASQKSKSTTLEPMPTQRVIEGLCSIMYPPIWIGEMPKPTFRQKASSFIVQNKIAFDGKYGEKVLVIYNDGFLFVSEPDRAKATRTLNELMATMLLHGKRAFAFREQELLLESRTHLQGSEFMESFVFSWLIIEKQLYRLWARYLARQALPKRRREKLTDSSRWTVDSVIESLNLVGEVSNEQYESLSRMRKTRNDMIHEGERVNRDQAVECIRVAHSMLKQEFRISGISLPN